MNKDYFGQEETSKMRGERLTLKMPREFCGWVMPEDIVGTIIDFEPMDAAGNYYGVVIQWPIRGKELLSKYEYELLKKEEHFESQSKVVYKL